MRPNLEHTVVADFESFFDKDYSLRSKELNTSGYIRDERFLAHCVSLKIGSGETKCYWYSDIRPALEAIDWSTHALLAHNTAFDGHILSHHYGIVPCFYYDTLSMARALHAGFSRAGLDVLGKLYGVGGKNPNILLKMKGFREIPDEIREEAQVYCIGDVDKCFAIFLRMLDIYPEQELELIDWTIRQFCDPVLRVDVPRAQAEVEREQSRKATLLEKVGLDEEELQSAARLAAKLVEFGVEPPKKISPRTGLETFAFSLQDDEFLQLGLHEDERVRDLIAARLAVKSTIAETRAQRFVDVGDRPFPVGLGYAAAHTMRWGGTDKTNCMNLEKEELGADNQPIPFTGELRKSLLAPEGSAFVVADSGQIEARITACLAQQTDLLGLFATGGDPYCAMAGEIYHRPITKEDRDERAVGKACFAADTLVITPRGAIKIIDVKTSDLLWDGEEWVEHSGLLPQGTQETYSLHQLSATPEHEILTEHGWRAWSEVLTHASLFKSALCSANTAYLVTNDTFLKRRGVQSATVRDAAARVDGRVASTQQRSVTVDRLDAVFAQILRPVQSAIGVTKQLWQTTSTALDCLIVYPRLSGAALERGTLTSPTTVDAALASFQNGVPTGLASFFTLKHSPDGMCQNLRWTGSTLMEIMNRAISVFVPDPKTQGTNAASPISKQRLPVYDLSNAGPRHRFTVLTDAGPLIVHNCILGLGYGMGAERFQSTLALGLLGPKKIVDLDFAENAVRVYRRKNKKIVALWRSMEVLLYKMLLKANRMDRTSCSVHKFPGLEVEFDSSSIWLPTGMGLHYHDLQASWDERSERFYDYSYRSNNEIHRIWGSALTENVAQRLARDIVAGQLLSINKRHRVVLMCHDDVAALAPKSEAESALAFMLDEMSKPPSWMPGLPLKAEGFFSGNYHK